MRRTRAKDERKGHKRPEANAELSSLGLPTHIRLLIYEHLFSHTGYLNVHRGCSFNLFIGLACKEYTLPEVRYQSGDLSIFCVCRSINEEVTSFLYCKNEFLLKTYHSTGWELVRCWLEVIGPKAMAQLRKIKIKTLGGAWRCLECFNSRLQDPAKHCRYLSFTFWTLSGPLQT
ncbi:hypothetical protein K458DRAFT_395594 [Lentithecium fluviatile CBS 122367]|uniref:Uncharacterized protein n=1 Tax=Lentithecium fluviatile CBS 122367 TaxID=1168545 RepID=A0A6G1II70_9PLEO|nr:hypothetical protein K458DRAFT_395594 [Lentithecium fluviatile CBS 122367]